MEDLDNEQMSNLQNSQEDVIPELHEKKSNVSISEKRDELESIFKSLEIVVPENKSIKSYALPNARQWLGPRFVALWVLPIYLINKFRKASSNVSPVRPYTYKEDEAFQIKGPETLHTSMREVFKGKQRLKFFGPRFIAIWVLPFAITGTVMELLFVSPLKDLPPFS